MAPLVRTDGSRHTGLAALPHRNIHNLSEIPECPPPRRHKLSGNLQNCWGIDYSKNDRFIIRPIGKFDINDVSSIVEIEIVDLEDYH